ncbi:MAG: peptidoglycan-binding domain-containing protein [Xanthobacteraceae bacterium]
MGTVKYRSLVKGGFFSSNPFDRSVPVSIRCNNPGAINGAAWEKTYPGYVDTVETTPGNKTTIFEAPEFGVAVWWELLRRYATRGIDTVGGVINQYGGGQDYSGYIRFVTAKTGFPARKKVSLDDDDMLLAFGRAMFHYEAGRPTPLKAEQVLYGLRLGRNKGSEELAGAPPPVTRDEAVTPLQSVASPAAHEGDAFTLDTRAGVKAIQNVLIRCGYLDPPADGGYGPVSKWALRRFAERAGLDAGNGLSAKLSAALGAAEPLPLDPGDDFAGRIVKAMQHNNYWIARHPDCANIVYVEGIDPDGTPNDNRNNVFNDVRVVFRVGDDGVPVILDMWEATTEPSRKFTVRPVNPAARSTSNLGNTRPGSAAGTTPTRRWCRLARSRAIAIRTRPSSATSITRCAAPDSASTNTGATTFRTTTWAIPAPAAWSGAQPRGTAGSCR